ncbi:MAG: ferrous iron transport protein B [Lachnospiraceae bacterium]|uniref:Ferrous iron transport protein B n=1 Tax=Candidatus Weimeria bifida TaxID=2599074 RepID=A0A6N7J0U1_9FIRM|nr:ferrous iron transport protein B [Candidatus Weimeria bifida]RRF96675.1 MAG: ferrous iron transport protein B [Lachnospiraceae bacterium]
MEIKIALAGNPNCGKTTLFNSLTGANQYVGNWPGVTVEKKEGRYTEDHNVIIQDLPGIYSLSPYTLEEVVSRNYLVKDQPDAILNIIDGTNIERNLYLTTQLIEVGIPVVMAINMMDVVRKNGDQIDTKKLGEALGCQVVEISALKGDNVDEPVKLAVKAAMAKKVGELPHVFTGSVEHAIAHIEGSIQDVVPKNQERWYAIKTFERDTKALEGINIPKDAADEIEGHIRDCEKEMDDDSESIITNQRYEYITELISRCVKKGRAKGELLISDKIDRVVTNRWLALPIFVGVMFLVYYVGVTLAGGPLTDWTNDTLFGQWIEEDFFRGFLFKHIHVSAWVDSLIVDGIVNGIATPLGFVPQMAIIFLFLGFLEDCGYMARVAFIMDRIFRKFGLSGKSFIPFLISSGCGVPGIMSTRTIESEKDRRMTMMTTTMIPCGAKLPVIAAIAGYVMGSNVWWFAPVCYFAGIGLVIVYCIILKKTRAFAGEPVPFVMELPAYHFPTVKGLLLHVWERLWAFIKKAGTILFLCCAVMWFLTSFGIEGGAFGLVDDAGNSLLAAIGGFIAPIFVPLGFGHWQPVGATLSGFVAKEQLVGTLSIVSKLGVDVSDAVTESGYHFNALRTAFTEFFGTGSAHVGASMGAISFLVFNIFDSPCLAAISSMAKEIGDRKKFWQAIAFQNISAWCVALMVYQIIGLFNGVPFSGWTVAAFAVLAGYLFLLFRPDPNKKYVEIDRGGISKAKA